MGLYINPRNETKEEFLVRLGQIITHEEAKTYPYPKDGSDMLVCLVDNGSFTAAGIADFPAERDRFIDGAAGRPTTWFLVPKEHLTPYLKARK